MTLPTNMLLPWKTTSATLFETSVTILHCQQNISPATLLINNASHQQCLVSAMLGFSHTCGYQQATIAGINAVDAAITTKNWLIAVSTKRAKILCNLQEGTLGKLE